MLPLILLGLFSFGKSNRIVHLSKIRKFCSLSAAASAASSGKPAMEKKPVSKRNRVPAAVLYERPERPKLHGYEFWREVLHSPKYVMAPMVDASELAYRLLGRRYGVDLAYTPMMFSKIVAVSHKHFIKEFQTTADDTPLLAQFCGTDAETMVAAAKKVEKYCEAVDLNLGCPQHCARGGGYGAFLMDKPDVVASIVSALHQSLSVPVTCKMRIKPTLEETIEFAQMLEKNGASVIGVHGRTRDQKGKFPCPARWDFIREIKRNINVPLIANGSIRDKNDADQCMHETGADAVMSAWALLENPAVFNSVNLDDDIYLKIKLAKEYTLITEQYPTPRKWADSHYYQLLLDTFQRFPEEARRFECRKEHDSIYDFLDYLEKRWQNPDADIPVPFGAPRNKAQVFDHVQVRRERQQDALDVCASDIFDDNALEAEAEAQR